MKPKRRAARPVIVYTVAPPAAPTGAPAPLATIDPARAAAVSPFRHAAADELGRRAVGGLVALLPGLVVGGIVLYLGSRALQAWRAWRARKAEPRIGVRVMPEQTRVDAAPVGESTGARAPR